MGGSGPFQLVLVNYCQCYREDQDTFPVQGGGTMVFDTTVHLAVRGFSEGKEEKFT